MTGDPTKDDLPKRLIAAARRDALTQEDRVAIGQAIARLGATTLATPGWRNDITPTELGVIRALIALTRATFIALDDSEEFEGEDGRCHSISGQDFDDVEKALDVLDELPDDRPGYTLASYGKAQWALRRILGSETPSARHGDANVIYRWHALDHSGFCYGSNPPENLPESAALTAFFRQPDAFQNALDEISATGNLTATPAQFARHLQKLATDALNGATTPDATGRTPQDYAIEHAEYLAKSAEKLLDAINDRGAL
ncbi:hypothetical protein [Ottowia oryzae]